MAKTKEEIIAYKRQWYLENKARLSIKSKEHYAHNKESYLERSRQRRIKFKEEIKLYKKEHYAKNKKEIAAYKLNHSRKKPWLHRARNAKRRAIKLQRTPKWLTKDQLQEINHIFEACPQGYEVDHIVPLQGKTVSGLHVPWNLQYLKKADNIRKSNKHESDGE